MKSIKVIFSFLLVLFVSSCLSDSSDDSGIEQYYENRDEGIAFLEKNKQRSDEVTVTISGLQYEVLEEGEGASVLGFDTVKFKYTMRSIDGTLISSNESASVEDIPYSQVNMWFEEFIPEGLQLMSVGSKYKFYVPYQIGYGQNQHVNIPPFSALIFEIELLENFFVENALKENIHVTDSGLQYEILNEGSGDNALADSRVSVYYKGSFLNNNQVFDGTIVGSPAKFYLNQVISGWTEGLQLMNPGAKYKFYIPYNLAYGEKGNGSIPPYSPLIFEVELLEILE